MKKIIVIAMIGLLVCAVFHQALISSIQENFLSKPASDVQQRQEFFNKLSLHYYGVPDFGAELDLVNSAVPLAQLKAPGADLIIPEVEAMQRLKLRQTVTFVEMSPLKK